MQATSVSISCTFVGPINEFFFHNSFQFIVSNSYEYQWIKNLNHTSSVCFKFYTRKIIGWELTDSPIENKPQISEGAIAFCGKQHRIME